jgi:hypothetical protein
VGGSEDELMSAVWMACVMLRRNARGDDVDLEMSTSVVTNCGRSFPYDVRTKGTNGMSETDAQVLYFQVFL